MQIVIDICKDDFEEICMQARMVEDTGSLFGRVRKSIFHGTPLPKGHGRLIDADKLLKEKRCFEDFDGDIFNIIHEETVFNAKTIIEADKADMRTKLTKARVGIVGMPSLLNQIPVGKKGKYEKD